MSPQWSLLKWFQRTLLTWGVLGHPRNGHWNNWIFVRKLTSYPRGRCSVWINGSLSLSIAGAVPCNRLQWVVMDLDVNYTLQSVHGMGFQIHFRYIAPSPMLLWLKYSSNITVRISPGWQFLVLDFSTLVTRIDLLKSPMRTLTWSDHSVICIKYAHETSYRHPYSLMIGVVVLHCELYPVTYHGVHCYIE